MTGKLTPQDFAGNRRAEARHDATRTIDVLPCRATDRARWAFLRADLVDCSLHGIGLLLDEPMDVGQQFLVKLDLPDRVRLLLYTVHNCVRLARRYRIGARFSGFAAQEYDEDLQLILDRLTTRA